MTKIQALPPTVSVVCPVFNVEDYLAEAIESVLAQDFEDFELLLVDDGSTDGSSAIARDFARRRPSKVRYLSHPASENRGPGAARNLGIDRARGAFVAFIDGDDRWVAAKLREQLAVFERHPDVDAVLGSVNYWRSWRGGADELKPTGHVRGRAVRPPEASLNIYPLAKVTAPSMSDLIVRRSVAIAIGGFEDQFVGKWQLYEDQTFLSKLYLNATIYISDSVWSDYRLHDRSCVARANRDGLFHGARSHFLCWFARFLRDNPQLGSPAVRLAVERARLPYRLPWISRPLRHAARRLRRRILNQASVG